MPTDDDHLLQSLMESEKEKSMLLSLSRDITSCRTKQDIQDIVTTRLAGFFQFNMIMVCLNSRDQLTHSCYIHTVTEETMQHPDFARGAAMKYFINDGIFDLIEASDEPVIFDMEELVGRVDKTFYVDFWSHIGVKEIIGFNLRINNESIGAITLYPKKKDSFTPSQLRLAQGVCSFIGIALSNILTCEQIQRQLEEIRSYRAQLEQENQYLQEQIDTVYNHGEVIGSDNGLQQVFELVSNVASSNSTVLIHGETGTGKELIARAIHNASPRRDKLMVKLNCAALPASLIESELFGHERGSFTGAVERRIGKFELANGSTLFLDEIGELAPELQAKLLRAIQEREVERIGGKTVIRVNVRIIAATNRNLQKEIDAGRFRSDLFYRLNVFPILLPPLRERKEDIPALVSHFVNRFARNAGKAICNVSPSAIRELMLYNWPGNVRELEHVVERSVLMTSGTTIRQMQLPKKDRRFAQIQDEQPVRSLKQIEKDHIVTALKKTNGKVGGPGGAAELLDLPATTLHSRIKKLGLKRGYE